MRRKEAHVAEKWQGKGWEFVSRQDRRFRTEMTFRRAVADRRWRLWFGRAGIVLSVIAGLIVASTQLPFVNDPLAEVRADAHAAFQALNAGDLAALDLQLAANRGQSDFAYFFTSKTTPRALGDALSTVAGESKDAPLKADIEPHAYDLTLTDLAGTLGLATFGTGDRALPAEWTEDFITATTTPKALYSDQGSATADAADVRADQDVANKQNLLLLLSRGYWSMEFLEATTEAYWQYDHDKGDEAWPGPVLENAKYAPAPTGHYLTDGILALTAALTANPEASAWAFTSFREGTEKIDGSDYAIGKFTHYLLFEHRFPQSSDDESIGMTATLTALSSAIDATRGTADAEAASSAATSSDDVGPMHDSVVLQTLAKELTDKSGCSWNPLGYLHCAVAVAGAVWHWTQHWGHLVLDILSLATFVAPPFTTVIGAAATATNATWYAIDGDYVAAGLSLAAVVPALGIGKIAKWVKVGAKAEKAAAEAGDVAKAANEIRAAVRATLLSRAKAGATAVEKAPRLFLKEKEAEGYLAAKIPGSVTGKSFICPIKAITCGVRRIVDIYVPKSKTAIEVKIGVRNQAQGAEEIQKDLELLRHRATDISKVEYHFLPDEFGNVGPSDAFRVALQKAHIPYVLHLL